MKDFIALINKAIEKIVSTNDTIQLVSDLDCDGVAAAAIMASGLMQKDKKFQITFANRITDDLIENLNKREMKLIIFTDLGSGYLNVINKLKTDVIVLDHHQVEGEPASNVIHINPEEVDLRLSGSGTAYLLVKEMTNNNALAPLAIVGTVGDVSYDTDSKLFETPMIDAQMGLNLFGRFSRPLYKSLEYSDIPEVNNESKAIQFLSEIGIKPQKDGEWRTLNDLSEDEKRKLTDAIVKESVKHGNFSKKMFFGDVLTLKSFPEELQDAKEFATILNACANMNEPTVGLTLCLSNGKNLASARNLLKAYRKVIGNYRKWVEENPNCVKQTENAIYIFGQDKINENFIGTIISMMFKPAEKTMIGFGVSKDGIKVSARSKALNIREVMVEAAKVCGGIGGGHEGAAGAMLPSGTQEKFMESCEEIIKRTREEKTDVKVADSSA
jgi:single-stranded-DNA-specific exonuclease